jgi:hypothetical protein
LSVELFFARVFFIETWFKYSRGENVFAPKSPLISGIEMTGYVVIWYLYFHWSIRVRNTFRRNL